ncbi:MAG: hypothetical protein OXG56_06660 [Gammaproteobacteria bacterium]|nr:hypothetical protein [Gammaproteobacteria bacterium]
MPKPMQTMNSPAHNDCLFCRNDLDSVFIRGKLGSCPQVHSIGL